MNQQRYIQDSIKNDALAEKKMAFLSGPRQVGKTTLAKSFLTDKASNFFSWDQQSFRKQWVKSPEMAIANRNTGPIILDEIHKDRNWKNRLKGIYDTEGELLEIVVTGSARLDIFRKGADSLLGRYIPYRIHPLSVSENTSPPLPHLLFEKKKVSFPLKDLLRLGGFPEPLLRGEESKALRWSRLRLDRLVNEDSRDLKNISDLQTFRLMLDIIPSKIGSIFSINSMREDLSVAYATLRDWVHLSAALYYGFFVKPYSKSITRALRSEPKFYLYDILQVEGEASRLENLTALHLLKSCHFWTDTAQGYFDLHFVRNKEKQEVDFLVTKDKHPWMLVECKSNDRNPNKNLILFGQALNPKHKIQLITGPNTTYNRNYPAHGITVMHYQEFFSHLV
ncbi:MAG: hypothetical protein A2504_09640 [Bdellovibrionales bacterium RIFOXYD12_FULL_39_22]|nr:MAG: hypothetical protein A2385_13130 [Bdellovibrionales bacterium RIFOXYB1_FULL_39_21]OFZ40989.1 MAG: hypothetical protein A2485_16640 [Bdellovibrionales bacterium RIFOXYC12_FULL_39_17]OFZ44817.1 MAG: hypothetical protein A2404_09930 [Bdellovibrionales bacterium RIFOXYC1_FULL_39_130]OFZ74096.1 MAG: hypothetical protein A2451_14580 [Bdellovibrionales bacterium RIFOXYC2_FULL_39_8]OFZ74282.1 MAG: hypothetical protein A2560_16895 [Bdellovibrionales bacterium RIFOXYD1_FULL_39_84]OFZ92146.1 MAG: